MKFPRFSKLQKHRQFNYIPMYYDAEKEAFENQVNSIKAKYGQNNTPQSNSPEDVKNRIKGAFKANVQHGQSDAKRKALVFLIAIFLLVVLVSIVLVNNL